MALEPRVIWSCESPGAVGVPPPPVLARWAVFLSALVRHPWAGLRVSGKVML